jgi:hypothetical protein
MVERKFSIDTIAEELQMEARGEVRGEGDEESPKREGEEATRKHDLQYHTFSSYLLFHWSGDSFGCGSINL